MDTNASTRPFNAVTYDVVTIRPNRTRVAIDQFYVAGLRSRKRMVRRVPSFLIFVPENKREIQHPAKRKFPRVRKIQPSTNLMTQPRKHIARSFVGIRNEKKQIPRLRAGCFGHGPNNHFVKELGYSPISIFNG